MTIKQFIHDCEHCVLIGLTPETDHYLCTKDKYGQNHPPNRSKQQNFTDIQRFGDRPEQNRSLPLHLAYGIDMWVKTIDFTSAYFANLDSLVQAVSLLSQNQNKTVNDVIEDIVKQSKES